MVVLVKMDRSTTSVFSIAELGTFFRDNRHDLLKFTRRHISDPTRAEEVVQDALVRVILAGPELESPQHALAYFRKAIQNLIIDIHRSEGRKPQLVLLEDLSEVDHQSLSEVADSFERLVEADDAAIVREALSLLSPAERTALVMWEIEGKSTAEIAAELGIKESAIRHTTARARTSLRNILSARVIDESTGMTALELLSKSYRGVKGVAKKSSRVALSMALVLSAFLGFSQLTSQEILFGNTQTPFVSSEEPKSRVIAPSSPMDVAPQSSNAKSQTDSGNESSNGKLSEEFQTYNLNSTLGSKTLEDLATPSSSLVSDAAGLSGELFVGDIMTYRSESGLMWSNIVSTKSEGPQVLISQSVILDGFGTSYVASVSIGFNGSWTPLNMAFVSSEVERLDSGNYQLSALFDVVSSMPISVAIPTPKKGSDFTTIPEFIATKLVLDPSKTQILAQSVLISAPSQGGKA